MTDAKRKRILELAESLRQSNSRLTLSKNMLRITISEAARNVIVEALEAYAGSGGDVGTAGGSNG